MRYSRILLLPIFLLALLTRSLFAQSSTPPEKASAADYGIDLASSYPGTMILELLRGIEDDASIEIEASYATGYKAGLLEVAPDRDYWKSLAETWRAEAESREADIFFTGATVGAAATVIALGILYVLVR